MSKLITIDNGHGLNTAGKRTPIFTDGTKSPRTGKNFMHEWEYNYATAKYLEAELKRCGFRTLMVSDTTADTSINTRVARANNAKADFFVSIHANALNGVWGSQNGVETFTYNQGEGLRIGRLVQSELVKATGLRDRGMKDGSKHLGVIRTTRMPAILVEGGFMDNLKEAKLLLSEAYRKKCAVAIAKGICRGFGVKYVPESGGAPATPTKPQAPSSGSSTKTVKLYKDIKTNSVVDFLKANNVSSSFANRSKLAVQYGITSYTGTVSQNARLLQALRNATKTVKAPATSKGTYFRVVTGSFEAKKNADDRVKAIKAKGFDSFIIPETVKGKTTYRVVTGSFEDRTNANKRVNELKKAGFDSFLAVYKK